MANVSNRESFLYLWQKRNLESETGGAADKADSMRFSLNQLQRIKGVRNDTNDLTTIGKEWDLMHHYGQLMDNKDGGLNNCAQPILALVGNAKNDSKGWQCSVKSEDLLRKIVTQNPLVHSLEPEYEKLANIFNNRNPQKPPLLNKQKREISQSQSSGDKPEEKENLSFSFNFLDDDMMEDETTSQVSHVSESRATSLKDPVRNNYDDNRDNNEDLLGRQQTLQKQQLFQQKSEISKYQKQQSFPPPAQIPKQSHSSNNFSPNISGQNLNDATPVNQSVGRGGGYPYPWNRGGRGTGGRGSAARGAGPMERGMNNRSHDDQNDRGYVQQRGQGTSNALGKMDNNWNGNGYGNEFQNNRGRGRAQGTNNAFGKIDDNLNDNGYGNEFRNNRGRGRGRGTSQLNRRESFNDEDNEPSPPYSSFKTASHQLALEQQKKFGNSRGVGGTSYGSGKRSLGVRRAPPVNNKFTPPVRREDEDIGGDELIRRITPGANSGNGTGRTDVPEDSPYAELMMDERLKGIDVKMVELIMNEIMDAKLSVTWDDIAGLKLAKSTIQEIVVWPMLRPDIFTGLRGPPKGLLLFGPPGTGKTMIGKCIASQSGSTFFSISASSLTSKWVGEGEKMVRALFAVARCHQPCVIFIDEIDSLLSQRSESEHESSRKIKTEFLVQLDGATTESDERMLVVGATNRPQELDEAARRRLVKRLYIPLPEDSARHQIIVNLLLNQSHSLCEADRVKVCELTEGYSGADMANLCREAALGPIRSINFADMQSISVDQVRPITVEDFKNAVHCIRASVSDKDLAAYEEWNKKYGISRVG